MSKKSCEVCGHPSARIKAHDLMLCNACMVVEEPSDDGVLVYVKTLGGAEEKKFIKLVPKR